MSGEAEGGEGESAPEGFVRLPLHMIGGFNALTGPWYARDEGGAAVFGFRVLAHHLNPAGMCHGGMLATFCDVMLPLAASYRAEPPMGLLPTISLSLDFLAPTPGGAWVEGRSQLLRRGRRMIFVQGLLTADGRPTVRASGTFNVPSQPTETTAVAGVLRTLLAAGG